MVNIPFTLIIPAAGSGVRMGTDTPKPFLSTGGKPVLEHTLSRFTGFPGLKKIVIATSEPFMKMAEQVAGNVANGVDICVVEGGGSRQESVYTALRRTRPGDGLMAIHDAVRPFTGRKEIADCLKTADKTGAAILAIPVNDTIKKAGDDMLIVDTPVREGLWRAQTPQIFNRELILEAHENADRAKFAGTDDASLVERMGNPVTVVEGSFENFKLTYPFDWKLAELLLEPKSMD